MADKVKRILIADDHKLFAQGLEFILLQDPGVKVVARANDGKEAIEKCLKESVDIVLMDINMPLIDGPGSCIAIKKVKPSVKIIFISMISNVAKVTEAINSGANAYILKGNDSDDIKAAITAVNKNEFYLSEQLRHFFTDGNPYKSNNAMECANHAEHLLSQREKEVLKMICEGLTNEKIAGVLSISVRTVDTHRTNLLTKLKLPNTAALVRFAVENKLI